MTLLTKLVLETAFDRRTALSGLRSMREKAVGQTYEGKIDQTGLTDRVLGCLEGGSVESAFEASEKEIEKMEAVKIYCPIEVGMDESREIGQQLRRICGDKFRIIEFIYSPKLIAGAQVSYCGRMKDYSVAARMLTENDK